MKMTADNILRADTQSPQELHAAVLRTIAYSDIFEYPLSTVETHRYLIGRPASIDEVARELSVATERGELEQLDGLYVLAGRASHFERRSRRNRQAERLWPAARRFGRLIGWLPFVRMVAVTGALAADNVEPEADLDYFVVTMHGFLWLTRAMILALDRVTSLLGSPRLCPNFLVTDTQLELEERDLFAAQELARMVPVFGTGVYTRMLAQNNWSRQYLPNAKIETGRKASEIGRVRQAIERILANSLVRRLEDWEMRRKIAKLGPQDRTGEARFTANQCKGHFGGHKKRTMQAYSERLKALGLEEA
jgi:hypothetical protein